MLPFGVGQFQNGQEALGYTFLIAESALAVASVTTYIIHQRLWEQYASANPGTVVFETFQSQLETAYNVNIYTTAALGLVTLTGILHAQLTFVPEVRETRVRPQPLPPPPPSLMPKVGAGPSGFVLGLGGRF
jgi:hypothetical protein